MNTLQKVKKKKPKTKQKNNKEPPNKTSNNTDVFQVLNTGQNCSGLQ